MPSGNTLVYCGAGLLGALIGSVLALALHGTVSGTDALGYFAGITALASGIVSHALGVSAGAKAASTPTPPAAKP